MRLTRCRNRFPAYCKGCGRHRDINSGWLCDRVAGEPWAILCDECCEDATASRAFRADPPRAFLPPCYAALGLTATGVSESDVRAAFRRLAVVHHPDHGGSEKAFIELHQHYETALLMIT